MTQFPWKGMLNILAKHELQIQNWPNILMPGEERGNGNRSKAIADLAITDQLQLATALGLIRETEYPIRFVKVNEKVAEGMRYTLSLYLLCFDCMLLYSSKEREVSCRRRLPTSPYLPKRICTSSLLLPYDEPSALRV